MATQRRIYDRQFKLDALQLWKNSDKTAAQIEQELGIGKGLLNKWKRSLAVEGDGSFGGKGPLTHQQERNRQLERDLARVTQEREILKKAVTIFSQTSR